MGSFSVSVWLMENLISGVKRGVFAQEFAALSATDYFMKGILSAAQVQQIALEAIYVPPSNPEPIPEITLEEPTIEDPPSNPEPIPEITPEEPTVEDPVIEGETND